MRTDFPICPLQDYMMIERESQQEEDNSVSDRLERLKLQYSESGMRRSAEALIVVTHRGFPHVLVVQVANAFYKLPGGYLDPSESFEDGLITRLNEQLGVPESTAPNWLLARNKEAGDWKVRECVSMWYRPNFDTFFYPYLPPQHTHPKEIKKVFMVELPPKKIFAVPANMKLHAIPVYELYDNAARYGPLFAGIPHILSK
ncbi:Cleavage/polyadenylation specificity factor subunit 5 [Dioszegia hungarica]|uniref:Cleavage and polyadenylation specificity factor subunit 5 n=1 Tax=Dioszegia hungarica TaxID=4972 RepID=A0AA38HC16_9TREE|nr:Cleavage/polyadenylation specificity factor subunit 5 [Dioszegia hungarica]KAI9637630.1 Cleavage/polyadenylation specificity factor subunit 5 [Dioszegia hungarica]